MQSAHEQDRLHNVLHAVKRRMQWISAGVAFGAWVVGTAVFLLAFVLVDHALEGGVPDPIRLACGAAYLISSACWLVLVAARPVYRGISDLFAARLIERGHPEFYNSVIGALQLGTRPDLPGSVRSAVRHRATRDVSGIDVVATVPARPLRQVGVVIIAVIVVFLTYAAVAPKSVMQSLWRAFGLPIPAPTRTWFVELTPDDGASVLRGSTVDFAARLRGQAPETVRIRFRPEAHDEWPAGQELVLTPSDGGRWSARQPGRQVREPVIWQAVAGDAVSAPRRLDVRDVPGIVDVQTAYTFPSYTGLEPETRTGGDIDAVVGTRVTIHATTSVPAHDPVLVLGDPPDERRHLLDAPTVEHPRAFTATLTVMEDAEYHLAFRDAHGTGNPEPIRYPIRARPDQPPTLTVDGPDAGIELLPDDVLPLRVQARDDFGLTRAVLFYQRPGGASPTGEIALPHGTGRSASVREDIPLERMQAEPGEVIEWRVSAWDNREDRRGRADHQRTDSTFRHFVVRDPAPPLAREDEEEDEPDDDQEPPPDALADADPDDRGDLTGDGETGDDPAAGDAEAEAPDTELAAGEAAGEPGEVPERDLAEADGPTTIGAVSTLTRADAPRTVEDFEQAYARELDTIERHLDAGPEDAPTASGAVGPAEVAPEPDQGGGQDASGSPDEPPDALPAEAPTAPGDQDEAQHGTQAEEEAGAPSPEPSMDESSDADPAGEQSPADQEPSGTPAEALADHEPGPQETAPRTGTQDALDEGTGQADMPVPAEPGAEASVPAEMDAAEVPAMAQAIPDESAPVPAGEVPVGEDPLDAADQAGLPADDGEGSADPADGVEAPPGGPADGDTGAETDGGAGAPGDDEADLSEEDPGDRAGAGGGGADEIGPGSPGREQEEFIPPEPPVTPAERGRPPESTGRIERLMSELDRRLRAGELDDALLDELGWDHVQTRRFVETYERLVEDGQRQLDATVIPDEVVVVPEPGHAPEQVDRADRAATGEGLYSVRERDPDDVRELMEVGRQRVAPRYRPLLEAYYRSVGTRPAD